MGRFNLEKIGKLLIKACTVGYTGTISWMVISGMSQEMPPILGQFLVPLLIIGVIEATLVVYWHLLDTNQDSTVSQRMIYIVLMLLAYIATQVIGLGYAHDILQGAIGVTVRLVMLGAMGASAWERGVLDAIRRDKAADKSIQNSKKVRQHARKLDEIEAMAERSAMHDVRMSFIEAETRGGMSAGERYAEYLEQDVKDTDPSLATARNDPKWQAWVSEGTNARSAAKNEKKQAVAELVKDHPDWSHKQVSDQTGIPVRTVSRYRQELLASNGRESANG